MLYAIVAKISIEEMFLAGIVPGLLMVALIAVWGLRQAPRVATTRRAFDWREARAALLDAKWELLLPVVAFARPVRRLRHAGRSGGAHRGLRVRGRGAWCTATSTSRRDVPRVMAECGLLVGGVLLILGVALGFTNYLVDARIPDRAVDWVTGAVRFALGVPARAQPVPAGRRVLARHLLRDRRAGAADRCRSGLAFGVDPIHLGIIFLANMELGYLTPPVGMNLFFTAYRFGKPLPEVFRAVLAPISVLAAAVLLVTFFPVLATGLPRLLK